MRKIIILFIVILSFVISCDNNNSSSSANKNMEELTVADNFDYKTTKNIDIDISVMTPKNAPVKSIPFKIYDKDVIEGAKLLYKGVTKADGHMKAKISVPAYLREVVVVGYMSTEKILISSSRVTHQFGGTTHGFRSVKKSAPSNINLEGFNFLGSFDQYTGKPDSITNVEINPIFLNRINASVPERGAIEDSLLGGRETLNLLEDCDVWITFLHEGAGYRNVLGFYKYTGSDNDLPDDPEDLSRTIIFPNASFVGGGGAMTAGDQVYMGRFSSGEKIGFFIIADGWRGGGNPINASRATYYSAHKYNPETTNKQHSVMLYDAQEEKIFLGFEDLNRDSRGCDNDFNDVVFCITANPITAIDSLPPIVEPADKDDDGVLNEDDAYPEDAERAFDIYNTGTLAFEDLWPEKGDYDFNDIVIEYDFHHVTNGDNEIKEINAKFKLMAVGAAFKDGFGIQLPVSMSNIESHSFSDAGSSIEDINNKATITLFENAFQVFGGRPATGFINTETDGLYRTPDTLSFNITLTDAVSPASLTWQYPYNPFIFADNWGEEYANIPARAIEIHLPDYPATGRANVTLFGTKDDNTMADQDRYYKTSSNLPWAINLPVTWQYPREKKQITWAYKRFATWAESGGQSYPDWFHDTTYNINKDYIYTKPQR